MPVNRQISKAGYLLKERRLANQLEQKTLAKKAGTSPSQISRIERGIISPSIDTLEKIFSAMGEELQLSTTRAQADQAASSRSILFP